MKILLVEDDPNTRRVLQVLLEQRGHEVGAFESAEEAEEALASESYRFLMLDWMLPGKAGIDFCREVRARSDGDEFFILLITARSDPGDLSKALEAGANDYLIKPFTADWLNVRLAVAERQIREIAERTASRVALRASARMGVSVLENTTEGFFALDSSWECIYVNPKAEQFFGCSRDQIVGQNFWKKFPEFGGSIFEKNCRRIAAENLPLEFEATNASGSACFEVHAHPNNGDIFLFVRDITERKRTEEERLKTSKLESLGTLAGGIAHDLNNILTIISGNIGLAQLEAPEESEKILPFLAKAGNAAQHAAGLSGQLLTFAKGGAPQKQVVSVGEIVKKASELSLYGSNLNARADITRDLWSADVDAAQIEQVVNALILNAREAMPSGGSLRIKVINVQIADGQDPRLRAGRYIKFTLTDEGRGIAPEVANKIFDPYYTTKAFGSGLGLSIGYSIVRKHGGVLELESTGSDGSTFAFYLPASDGAARAAEPPPLEGVVPFTRQRILVMDDDPGVRDLTSHLLGTLGFHVTSVPDGAEAVRAYQQAMQRGEPFDAVMLDATVRGGMGGVAALEKLRGLDPEVTAVICSGYSDEAALSEFSAYGFRGALPKPFTRHELAEALRRAMSKGRINIAPGKPALAS